MPTESIAQGSGVETRNGTAASATLNSPSGRGQWDSGLSGLQSGCVCYLVEQET